MGKSLIRENLLRSAVAVAATVALVGQANAAQFRGTWDPVYLGVVGDGTPFSSGGSSYLYFSGEAIFDTGSCGTTTGTYTANTSDSFPGCTGWSVVSATLKLGVSSDGVNPDVSGPTQTMSFLGSVGDPFVNAMKIDSAGVLSFVSSNPFSDGQQGTTAATLATWNSSTFQPYFSLAFLGEQAQLLWVKDPASAWSCVGDNTSIFSRECGAERATITFAPIPEPSTYALMGLGLAAVAAMRRRATRKSAQA